MSSSESSESESSSACSGVDAYHRPQDSSSYDSCDPSDEDDVSLRLVGDAQAQRKFRRLRRIFLSRPRVSKRSSRSPSAPKREEGKHSGDLETEREVNRVKSQCRQRPERGRSESQRTNRDQRRQSLKAPTVKNAVAPAGPLQEEIDQQIRALCEQVELLAAQRNSCATQRECALREAIDELQTVKLRQRQALETQTRVIEESYSLQLEVLEQQYQAKAAEIRREMRVAVQKQREECDRAVLAAVKSLQQQTQADLLGEMAPRAAHRPTDTRLTRTASGKRSGHDTWTFRDDARSFREHGSLPTPASPMTKQRAKLQAFEQKLRALPPASVDRVARQKQHRSIGKPAGALSVDTQLRGDVPTGRWQPTHSSPLRSSPSRWHRGISRESTRVLGWNEQGSDESESEMGPKTLTRRYLRPEEARELVRLRNSIGLAKDWMENNAREH